MQRLVIGVLLMSCVASAADDVPARLHPVAQRSLLAHLLKLRAENRVAQRGDRWVVPAP